MRRTAFSGAWRRGRTGRRRPPRSGPRRATRGRTHQRPCSRRRQRRPRRRRSPRCNLRPRRRHQHLRRPRPRWCGGRSRGLQGRRGRRCGSRRRWPRKVRPPLALLDTNWFGRFHPWRLHLCHCTVDTEPWPPPLLPHLGHRPGHCTLVTATEPWSLLWPPPQAGRRSTRPCSAGTAPRSPSSSASVREAKHRLSLRFCCQRGGMSC